MKEKDIRKPCIYCGQVKKLSKEHWFPRAFGNFRGIECLNDRVCSDCNGHTKIAEQALAQYSINGIFRRKLRIQGRKRKKQDRSPYYDALKEIPPLTIKADSVEHGCSLFFELREDGTQALARQVVIERDGKKTALKVPSAVKTRDQVVELLNRNGHSTGTLVKIIAHPDEISWINEFSALLGLAPDPPTTGSGENETTEGEASGLITELHARAVAKIAFHYLLKQRSDTYSGVEQEFSEIRNFIMNGVGGVNWSRYATPQGGRLLVAIPAGFAPSDYGHLMAIARHEKHIDARLRFFIGPDIDPSSWHVSLGRPPGITYSDEFGHYLRYFEKSEGPYAGELIEVPVSRKPRIVLPKGFGY